MPQEYIPLVLGLLPIITTFAAIIYKLVSSLIDAKTSKPQPEPKPNPSKTKDDLVDLAHIGVQTIEAQFSNLSDDAKRSQAIQFVQHVIKDLEWEISVSDTTIGGFYDAAKLTLQLAGQLQKPAPPST
jgi:hypothetical protein